MATSSLRANNIANDNAAASAIGPAYITPSIPIINEKTTINVLRIFYIYRKSKAWNRHVPDQTGAIPFAKVININIFR